jgi:ComF family protein
MLKSWLDTAAGFFYPPNCQLCHAEPARAAEGYVGRQCERGVRWIVPPFCERCGLPYEGAMAGGFVCSNCREMNLQFQSARAAVVANPLVLDVVHRYKYRRALWFEPFLARLLTQAACPALASGHWDQIVPVPLHPLKRREREFNQAERLARRLAKASRIPCNTRLLRRVEPTRTQTLLSRQERTRNVQNAFQARPDVALDGARIVLVDDVLTTGATTSACARALRKAGAGEVCVWTVARGL